MPVARNELTDKAVMSSGPKASGNCQESGDTDRQLLTANDPILRQIVALWAMLPVHVRYQVAEICLADKPEEDMAST